MNRRIFLRGSISVMAIAAIVRFSWTQKPTMTLTPLLTRNGIPISRVDVEERDRRVQAVRQGGPLNYKGPIFV